MDLELRISISILLLFFIYGLTSLFSIGGFVTPYFFSKLILVGTSLFFLLINLKLKNSFYLLLCFIAMIGNALMDDFTVGYLSEKMASNTLNEWSHNIILIYASFFLFFGFFIAALFYLFNEIKKKTLTLIMSVLLIGTIALFFFQAYLIQQLVFSLFLVLYYISVNKFGPPKKTALSVLSAQFLLIAFLEVFKYLV